MRQPGTDTSDLRRGPWSDITASRALSLTRQEGEADTSRSAQNEQPNSYGRTQLKTTDTAPDSEELRSNGRETVTTPTGLGIAVTCLLPTSLHLCRPSFAVDSRCRLQSASPCSPSTRAFLASFVSWFSFQHFFLAIESKRCKSSGQDMDARCNGAIVGQDGADGGLRDSLASIRAWYSVEQDCRLRCTRSTSPSKTARFSVDY